MTLPPAFAASDARGRIHLVLDGVRRALTVSLDGEALRISQADAADALAPIRLIDRVTCRGAVTWGAGALVALADIGAPVGFIAEGGRLAAALVGGGRAGSQSFGDVLESAASRPDLAVRLEDWRRAQISRLARRLGVEDPAGAARSGWPGADAALADAARPAPRSKARRFAREARAFSSLLARRALHEAGCPPDWMGVETPAERDLCSIIAQIAAWRLAAALEGGRGRRLQAALRADADAGAGVGGPALMAAAEMLRPRLRRDLAGDLARLREFIRELGAGPIPQSRITTRRWAG